MKVYEDDCLTRIACKTIFKSILNETLLQVTSTSNYWTLSPNRG